MRTCFRLAFAILYLGSVCGTVKDSSSIEDEIILPRQVEPESEARIDDDDVTLLSEIAHFTGRNYNIDITLSRESFDEECFIRPPSGDLISADIFSMEGVKVQDKSHFVSCRITIGPMTEDLLGNWQLCGKSSEGTRCRPASITWNSSNGAGTWYSLNLQRVNHPVHFGGSVNPGVTGSGSIATCHVVTPLGEDLVITTDMNYTHIERGSVNNEFLCSIIIKDITADVLGDWIVYGMFRSMLAQNEYRLPLTLAIYNEDDPFEQARNVTTLQAQQHLINLGTNLTHEVSTRRGTVEDCVYRSPSGQTFNLENQSDAPDGVYFNSSETLCQIDFNPITADAVGEWQLIGKFSNGILFDESRLTFTIIQEDPSNPIQEDIQRTIENLTAQNIETTLNTTHSFIIDTITLNQHESCHLLAPDGRQYAFIPGFNVPNVEILSETRVDCGIRLTIASEDMAGEWTLMARATTFMNTRIERRLRFTIRLQVPDDENTITFNPISHFTRQQARIDISLPRETFDEECLVQPPMGDLIDANLISMEGVQVHDRSQFVSCRVTIGPMTESLLGVWRLCGRSVELEQTRCQPVNITWNSNNGAGSWDVITQPVFNHPVHFGGSVNSGVASSGSASTCHVITPAGEDLVITSERSYPHIERSTVTDASICSIIIKDITEDMLGDWIIYGVFRSWWQSEVRRPLTFSLYNENNPYDQAYNVTTLQNQQHLVHVGTNLTLEVSQRLGTVEDCIYRSPSGQTFNLDNHANAPEGVYFSSSQTQAVCQIHFSPITAETLGEWQLFGKFRNGVLYDESRLTFTVIEEDPDNPIQEDVDRVVENLTARNITTDMNTVHRITINTASFVERESCHLITPDGRQYAFITGFNVPNVQIISQTGVECGVELNLDSEGMIGEWTLLARATRLSVPIERRLRFSIRVEENFVIRNDIHIKEGADLYLHLNDAISLPETCMLFGPSGNEYTNVEIDGVYANACGYIIRDADNSHNGTWVIEYGDRIKQRGSINVQVLDSQTLSFEDMRWIVGDALDVSVGPENAVYCKIQDCHGHTVFDDFGPCKIVLDRVTIDHEGAWKMSVALPGTVRLQEYEFLVDVIARDGKPLVTTAVERNAPSVMLTCSVPVEHEVHACKFRDPRGNILVAAHGVGQDGYMFNGSIVNYESETHSHDCTLRLTNPSVLDLGIWRCAMDTSTGTYYGFLTVVCPYLMQDPEVAASVITEPVLQNSSKSYLEGEAVTLSCSIQSPLQYCYFRARNGTTYNVFPRMPLSENFEYIGAGLDAGDCGIRFQRFSASEAGLWSCHAGLADSTAPELRTDVYADVRARMTMSHHWNSQQLVLEAQVYDELALDYCRFVRMNGQGFSSFNVPDGYEIEDTLHKGTCSLHINSPDIIDLHPWTIVAKIAGAEGEISMTTTDNLLIFPTATNTSVLGDVLFWLLIVIMCLIPILAGSILIPKKNREWTYRRASRMSRSFRTSWRNTFGSKTQAQMLQKEQVPHKEKLPEKDEKPTA